MILCLHIFSYKKKDKYETHASGITKNHPSNYSFPLVLLNLLVFINLQNLHLLQSILSLHLFFPSPRQLWAPITLTSNPTYIALNVFGLTLVAKLKEEKFIQRSGLNYTIVRAGGLRDNSPSRNLDTLFQGSILRDQVAEFAVGALLCSESSFKVVEIVARR
ncbi:unnamed protein product [Spirodela intermedia]|uniref:NAD(P)-binding domain-containing protein n=1 Tax=Spirodela intermedia TaxID=51605 RepID=A0A7I8J2A3_SPIIN|nr:unnamed protein product [Spirodela intermedia]CAA6664102.1 unnamed protein product [Spirodela intermedia]